MTNTLLLNQQTLFGLFELDPSGVVLYCRIEPDAGFEGTKPDVTGRNFFKEVVPFENADEFRRRINAFANGGGQADNFNFTFKVGGQALTARVLLARIRERSNGTQMKSVLVHIRKL